MTSFHQNKTTPFHWRNPLLFSICNTTPLWAQSEVETHGPQVSSQNSGSEPQGPSLLSALTNRRIGSTIQHESESPALIYPRSRSKPLIWPWSWPMPTSPAARPSHMARQLTGSTRFLRTGPIRPNRPNPLNQPIRGVCTDFGHSSSFQPRFRQFQNPWKANWTGKMTTGFLNTIFKIVTNKNIGKRENLHIKVIGTWIVDLNHGLNLQFWIWHDQRSQLIKN